MKRSLIAAALLSATAIPVHASPSIMACPLGSGFDGCMSNMAPAGLPSNAYENGWGTIQFPDFFTCTSAIHCGPQSGQLFINRPNFNVAGVDFPVGPWTPVAAMCDPSAQSGVCTLPPGCVYGAGGGTVPPSVYCQKSSTVIDVSIHGWNFDATPNHGAIKLTFDKSLTGHVAVYDNNFGLDSTLFVYDTTTGYYGIVDFGTGSGSYYVYSNQFNGHSRELNYLGARAGSGDVALFFASNSHPAMVANAYNAFFNLPGHVVSITTSQLTATQVFDGYNYYEGWDDLIGSGHGEVFGFEGRAAAMDFEHDTFLAPQDMCNCGTTVIYPSAVTGTTIASLTINGNTIISGNHTGGAQMVSGYAYTAVLDNGAGTGVTPGNILTIVSQTKGTDGPTFGMNSGYKIGTTTYNIEIAGHVPGSPASGVGSQWYVSASQGATYFYPPQVSLASGGALAYNPSSFIAYPQGMTFNWGQITGAITITNNYVDWTHVSVPGVIVWGVNGAGVTGSYACGLPSVISGNQDLTTLTPLAAVNSLQKVYHSGSTGGC